MPLEEECLPFATWMERALFAPGKGYYSAQIRTVGRRGDFATTATTSGILGDAIGSWLREEHRRHPGVEAVIEVGGGDGSLSASVRKALGWWGRRSWSWHMVEVSPVLRAKQREKLGGATVHWHDSMASALEACAGQALIFHNELVDAFPVILLEWDQVSSSWREVWLCGEGAGWKEILRPLPLSGAGAAEFSALRHWSVSQPPPHPRQRVELQAVFRQWLGSWAPLWRAGSMLTVDYGDRFPSLYHRRPRGTVRAYLLHQRIEGPDIYANMGRQDLTSDVNFTDLLAWGEALGWESEFFGTQAEFLKRHSGNFATRVAGSPADAWLADEAGAGGAFKVWNARVRS